MRAAMILILACGCFSFARRNNRYARYALPVLHFKILVPACLVGVQCLNAGYASPWPQAKGDIFFIQLTELYEVKTEASPRTAATRFEQLATGVYIEYGLFKNWTVGAEGIYYQQSSERESEILRGQIAQSVSEGWGKREVFIQRSFVPELPARLSFLPPLQMAVRGSIFVRSDLTQVDTVLGEREMRRDGGGKATFLVGHNFNEDKTEKSYFSGEVGYRYHNDIDPDYLEIELTYGRALTKKIEWSVKSYNSISLGNGEIGGTDFDFYRLEVAVLLKNRFGIFEIGVVDDLEGRNLNLGQSYFLKIWERF